LQHLSLNFERDTAKNLWSAAALELANHFEKIIHIHFRVLKIICSIALSYN